MTGILYRAVDTAEILPERRATKHKIVFTYTTLPSVTFEQDTERIKTGFCKLNNQRYKTI